MKKWRKRILISLGVFSLLLLLDYHLFPALVSEGRSSQNRGENGIWLRYKWYFGEHAPALVGSELAPRFKRHGIKYAYFHVRYIKPDGALKFRFPSQAKALNAAMKEHAPETKSIAWIFAGNGKHGDVDLSKPEVRQKMAEEAAWLVSECGFEGVQWDYEICRDGDDSFLDLLERTRKALPTSAFLGVASPLWLPLEELSWSPGYFSEVSKRCDQIAVMCYDTGTYFPRAYLWLMEQQVHKIAPFVNGKELIFGLPAYEEGPPSHNSHAENLRLALIGIRRSLEAGVPSNFAGISPFADYTMDESEWEILDRLWPETSGE